MQAVFVHAGDSPGPAPNSGEGVPDGSGFDQDEWINYGGVYAAVVLIGFAILIAYLRKGSHMPRALYRYSNSLKFLGLFSPNARAQK